jgi:ADP-heptose:LPS heptosyltransferase/spore maturation protein CgeB
MKRPVALLNMTRMGDLLMTGPMIEQLRMTHPGHEIHLIVVEGFAPIARGLGADKVLPVDFNLLTTVAVRSYASVGSDSIQSGYHVFASWIESLGSIEYEAIYNITHTRISAVLATLMNGPVKGGIYLDSSGFRRIAGRWARYWFAGNLSRGINPFHLVDLNAAMASISPETLQQRVVQYPRDDKNNSSRENLKRELGLPVSKEYFVVQAGASSDDKRWPETSFGLTAKLISEATELIPVFVGTSEEKEWAEAAAGIAGPESVILAGKTSLEQLASVLENARLLITNDTGTMHLAQAVGTRSLVVTLGSALSDETGPYGEGNVIIEPDLDCFPCDFKETCDSKRCHHAVIPKQVAKLAHWMLNGGTGSAEEIQIQGTNIWRTGFDEDGWWQKQPLHKQRFRENEIWRLAYRHALKLFFEIGDSNLELRAEILINQLNERTDFEDKNQLAALLRTSLEQIEPVLDLAERGKVLAAELSDLVQPPVNQLDRMSKLAGEIEDVDEKLLKTCVDNPLLRPAITLMQFDRENLHEVDLGEQAEETHKLHERFINLVTVLQSLLHTARNVINRSPLNRSDSWPVRSSGAEQLQRPRFRTESLTILLPTSGYFLQNEIASALTQLGHRVVPIPFEDRDDVIARLLTESLDADLLVTVNHLGFDRNGELASLLDRIGMPYISWFVDRPAYILLNHEIGPTDLAWIRTWEKKTVSELKGYGFRNVEYMPLAVDDRRFKLNGRKEGEGTFRFVANSMVFPVREWIEKAQLEYDDPYLQEAVGSMLKDRKDPELAMHNAFKGAVNSMNREQQLITSSAIALAASGKQRELLVREYDGKDLHLYGDEGWKIAAPSTTWHGHVEYPRQAAMVYRDAIHLNVTSFQMQTAVNQRVFDVPASGGVLITDDQSALRELFDTETECLVFNSLEEARDLSQWAAQNRDKAKAVSLKAANRIQKQHTYAHRLQKLLDEVRKQAGRKVVAIAGGKE